MSPPGRRRVLRYASALAVGALAGCLSVEGWSGTESPKSTDEATDDDASLTEWERSTDCEREPDGMYDSVIRVQRVSDSLGDQYAPINFDDLSPEERTILRTVTEAGGYGTCDASDAFGRFVGRVADHADRQEADRMRVYLERDETYYGLYVEVQDQVYAH